MIPRLVLSVLLVTPVAAVGAGYVANGPVSPQTKSAVLTNVVCSPDSLMKKIYFESSYFVFEGKLKYQIIKGDCEYIPRDIPFARTNVDAEIIAARDDTITVVESGTVGNDPRTWYHLLQVPRATE